MYILIILVPAICSSLQILALEGEREQESRKRERQRERKRDRESEEKRREKDPGENWDVAGGTAWIKEKKNILAATAHELADVQAIVWHSFVKIPLKPSIYCLCQREANRLHSFSSSSDRFRIFSHCDYVRTFGQLFDNFLATF
jgi:hypothetical protein